MEHLEEVLKELGFTSAESKTLIDETKKDEHTQIISDCRGRYNDVLIKQPEVLEHFKTEPKLKEFFKKELELPIGKEAVRKDRKKINTELNLGLTNSELEDEGFYKLAKEKSGVAETQKVKDLQDQLEEERRLKEEAEGKLTTEVEKVKTEYSVKDKNRAVELRKAQILSKKDSTKFDISNPKSIEKAFVGAQVTEGIDFLIEGDKIFVTKDGKKIPNKTNNFTEIEEWAETNVYVDFGIKQKGTPPGDGQQTDGAGNPEMSEHAKKMAADLEKRGIKVYETVQ